MYSDVRRLLRGIRGLVRKSSMAAAFLAAGIALLTACGPESGVPAQTPPVGVPAEAPGTQAAPPSPSPGAEREAVPPQDAAAVTPMPASTPAPAIVVIGNGTRIAAGDDSPNRIDNTDFVGVPQGRLAMQTFRITNVGGAVLSIQSIEIPDGFLASVPAILDLAPGASATLNLWPDSAVAGTKTGTVRITSNAARDNPFEFAVRGEITPAYPAIALSGGAIRILHGDMTPATHDRTDFGVVDRDMQAAEHLFTIHNDGAVPLILGALTVPAGFVLVTEPDASIAPGGRTTFAVRLDTAAFGTATGAVQIEHNGLGGSFLFAIHGRVKDPTPAIAVYGNGTGTGDSTQIANGSRGLSTSAGTIFGVDGTLPAEHTYTIRNTGRAVLVVDQVRVSEGFVVLQSAAGELLPGESMEFRLGIAAATGVNHSGLVTIDSNAPDSSLFTFAIMTRTLGGGLANPATALPPALPPATVQPARINVFGNERNIVNRSNLPIPDDHTDFGSTFQGGNLSRTFTIRNTGSYAVSLAIIEVPNGFVVIQPPIAMLPPETSTEMVVQLDDSVPGTYRGVLSIGHDATANLNPFAFEIAGTVLAPTPRLVILGGNGTILPPAAEPHAMYGTAFELEQNPEPAVRDFLLHNDGVLPLVVGVIEVPVGIFVAEQPVDAIAPGGSAPLKLGIDTSIYRSIAGPVIIHHNGELLNPFTFGLRGLAGVPIYPYLVVTGNGRSIARGATTADRLDHTDFGHVTQGTVFQRIFMIRNSGAGTLRLNDVELPPGFEIAQPYPRNIAPGGTALLQVRIDTSVAGAIAGEIRIVSNDPRSDPFTFAVQGAVIETQPAIALFGAGLAIPYGLSQARLSDHTHFGSVAQGSAAGLRTFTIRNDGTLPLLVGELHMPEGFELIAPPEPSVAPGASTTFTVRLDSSVPGLRSGTIAIDHNDQERSPYRFAVQGLVTIVR